LNPAQNALNLLKKYSIDKPDNLNLEEISYAERLIVDEEPMENCLGRTQFKKDIGLVKINSNITDKGQKRFTLAHEMGHYFNEKDIRQYSMYACTVDDINSFNSNKIFENNANEFAAELLIPTDWFKKFTGKRELNVDLIKETAQYFNTSLTATAIKYAVHGTIPSAVIMSKEGKVVWHCPNEYFPLKWIPKDYKLNKYSGAYKFFKGRETTQEENLIQASVWYFDDYNCRDDVYLFEQNVFMPNYNSVLTLLWMFED